MKKRFRKENVSRYEGIETPVPGVPNEVKLYARNSKAYYMRDDGVEVLLDDDYAGSSHAHTTVPDHDHSGDTGDGGTFDGTNVTSGAAGDGTVLTADGASGAAWEALPALANHDHTGDAGDGGALSGIFRSVQDLWFQDNVAANQTDVGLLRADHVGSAPDAYVNTLIAGLAGSVQYIYVKLNANQSAGTLTVTLTVDGAAQAMTAAISTAVAFVISTAAAVAFTGAQRLALTITTSADWAPATADLRAGMIIAT